MGRSDASKYEAINLLGDLRLRLGPSRLAQCRLDWWPQLDLGGRRPVTSGGHSAYSAVKPSVSIRNIRLTRIQFASLRGHAVVVAISYGRRRRRNAAHHITLAQFKFNISQLAWLAERPHHGCRPVVPAIVHSGCYNPISGDRRGPQSWFRAFPSAWANERLGKCFPDRVVSLVRGSFRLAEEHSGGFKWIPAGAGGVARGNGTALVVAGPSKKV